VSILTEIKGCISGWLFYQSNKNKRTDHTLPFPDELKKDAHTDSETLVTVVIPCYNHGKYLSEAIESVFHQTHKKVEIVVVDDGSEDDTAAICSNYGNRIKYVRVERVGLSAARNTGVQFSSGKFLVFLDADDFLYPNAIEINLYFFNYKKSAVFVSGGHNLTDEKGNPLPTKNFESKLSDNYLSLLQGNYIAMEATVMYRRELFFHFHFDTQLKSCEDYDLNLNISRHFPVMSHDKIIAGYRQHGKNMSANRALMRTTVLEVLQRQEKMLQNDEERKAYESGLKNWEEFYK
jgi:glycosyltransferase involved in cell wall biosynthesis